MSGSIYICGPNEMGLMGDDCWWCEGSLRAIKKAHGQPYKADGRFGRYCSLDCADRAAEEAQRGSDKCTVCGNQKGRCSTDDPDDPHEFIPFGLRSNEVQS